MLNEKTYTLKVNRIKVVDLMMACTSIWADATTEMNDPNTSEDRKKVLEGTVRKWKGLHDELKEQLEAQDAKNGF